jgi:hypothetical protein
LTDEKKSEEFQLNDSFYCVITGCCVITGQKSGKSLFLQLGFPFLNGNLKNTFIFNFQLSILNSACIREK